MIILQKLINQIMIKIINKNLTEYKVFKYCYNKEMI